MQSGPGTRVQTKKNANPRQIASKKGNAMQCNAMPNQFALAAEIVNQAAAADQDSSPQGQVHVCIWSTLGCGILQDTSRKAARYHEALAFK